MHPTDEHLVRVQETKDAQLGIRTAKMKEARLRAEGMGGSRAGKAATGADKKSSKPRRKRARCLTALACNLNACKLKALCF